MSNYATELAFKVKGCTPNESKVLTSLAEHAEEGVNVCLVSLAIIDLDTGLGLEEIKEAIEGLSNARVVTRIHMDRVWKDLYLLNLTNDPLDPVFLVSKWGAFLRGFGSEGAELELEAMKMIMRLRDLESNAKIVLSSLCGNSDENGAAIVDVTKNAVELDLHPNTIKKHLVVLEDLMYIVRSMDPDHPELFFINIEKIMMDSAAASNSEE